MKRLAFFFVALCCSNCATKPEPGAGPPSHQEPVNTAQRNLPVQPAAGRKTPEPPSQRPNEPDSPLGEYPSAKPVEWYVEVLPGRDPQDSIQASPVFEDAITLQEQVDEYNARIRSGEDPSLAAGGTDRMDDEIRKVQGLDPKNPRYRTLSLVHVKQGTTGRWLTDEKGLTCFQMPDGSRLWTLTAWTRKVPKP